MAQMRQFAPNLDIASAYANQQANYAQYQNQPVDTQRYLAPGDENAANPTQSEVVQGYRDKNGKPLYGAASNAKVQSTVKANQLPAGSSPIDPDAQIAMQKFQQFADFLANNITSSAQTAQANYDEFGQKLQNQRLALPQGNTNRANPLMVESVSGVQGINRTPNEIAIGQRSDLPAMAATDAIEQGANIAKMASSYPKMLDEIALQNAERTGAAPHVQPA
jgi:hypothetical protein